MSDPTMYLTIQGIAFKARAPYAAGHPLTEIEAAVLNQCRADNLRNNFAKTVKAYKDNGSAEGPAQLEALRAKFTEYDASYTFHAPSSTDPIDTEARRIAIALVREELNRRGTDPQSVSKDRFEVFVAKVAAMDSVRAEAARRHAVRVEAAAATGILFDEVNP